MSKVLGIGGIFFRTKDPKVTREWYANHLGFKCDDYGTNFSTASEGYALWSPFASDSDYFASPEQQFMINFRVENIEELVDELKQNGVEVVDEIESFEYGKFVHILDCDGFKVELWEAVNSEYEKIVTGTITNE